MRWLTLCLCVLMLVGCGGVSPGAGAEPVVGPGAEPEGQLPAPPRTMLVTAGVDGMLQFQPPVLFARQGEQVELTLVNADSAQAHSLVIPDLNAKSRQVMPGQRETISFVADKTGDFRFFCDVPGHKDAGEVGRLSVEP